MVEDDNLDGAGFLASPNPIVNPPLVARPNPSENSAWAPPPSVGVPHGGAPTSVPFVGSPSVPGATGASGAQPWWGTNTGQGALPSAPPQYDPYQYGTTFGAAGGSPTMPVAGVVPRLPGTFPGASGAPSGAAGDASSRRAPSTRSGVLIAVLSAVIASLITGGLFVAFGRAPGVTTAAGTAASAPGSSGAPGAPGSRGTIVTPLDIYQLLDRAQPSVVSIRTQLSTGTGVEAGSGVLISEDGLVLTNAHVVAGASSIKVTLFDGSTKAASLVGSFPQDDIALVKMKDASGLQPAELGRSTDMKVGEPVVAIGNALNLGGQPSVTQGIVSAKNREIQAAEGTYKNLIQTDAAINPGNSGGPLLNAGGQVVGINTAIIKDAQNIGFAISIDAVKPLIDDLKNGKGAVTPDSPFLGVSSQSIGDVNAATIDRYQVTAKSGAFVSSVVPGSAADETGLAPGDVIIKIDGNDVTSAADVGAAIRKKKAGESVKIDYERKGQAKQVTATLKSRGNGGG